MCGNTRRASWTAYANKPGAPVRVLVDLGEWWEGPGLRGDDVQREGEGADDLDDVLHEHSWRSALRSRPHPSKALEADVGPKALEADVGPKPSPSGCEAGQMGVSSHSVRVAAGTQGECAAKQAHLSRRLKPT